MDLQRVDAFLQRRELEDGIWTESRLVVGYGHRVALIVLERDYGVEEARHGIADVRLQLAGCHPERIAPPGCEVQTEGVGRARKNLSVKHHAPFANVRQGRFWLLAVRRDVERLRRVGRRRDLERARRGHAATAVADQRAPAGLGVCVGRDGHEDHLPQGRCRLQGVLRGVEIVFDDGELADV